MCCTWKGWWGLAVARGGSDCLPQLLTRRSLCSGVGAYFDFPLVGLGRCGFSRWCSSRCGFFQFFWTNCFATNSCVNQRYALKPDIFFYFPSSGATVSCAKNRGFPWFFSVEHPHGTGPFLEMFCLQRIRGLRMISVTPVDTNAHWCIILVWENWVFHQNLDLNVTM